MLFEICVMRQLRDPVKVSRLTSIEDRRGFLSSKSIQASSEERRATLSKTHVNDGRNRPQATLWPKNSV